MKNLDVIRLRERVRSLEHENALLKQERDFFRQTPTLAQGLKGETLIAQLTGGILTGYKDPHDVTVKSGDRLEVKYSHLNVPGNSKTRRWNWHSVWLLGGICGCFGASTRCLTEEAAEFATGGIEGALLFL